MSALRINHPGKPVQLINLDPYAVLTRRQQQVFDAVLAHNGNRSRAARQLKVRVQTVQYVLRIAEQAGIPVPRSDRRGTDLRPRQDRSRKLTPDTVRLIRESTEMTHRLAAQFGVGRTAIKDIRSAVAGGPSSERLRRWLCRRADPHGVPHRRRYRRVPVEPLEATMNVRDLGWSMGELYAVVGTVLFWITLVVAVVIGRLSETWGNRIALVAFVFFAAGLVLGVTNWNEPIR